MALILTGIFTGCSSESSCPKDSLQHGDRCIESDSGTNQDASDSAMDGEAGPCGVCPTDKPLCDETSNTCVTCLENTDCPEASSARCDTAMHTCIACTDNTDCSHIFGNVCDTSDGACVECTGTQYTACSSGTNVCDSSLRTCTATPVGMTADCQACVSDAQCLPGMLCVPMTFGSPEVSVGNYCLWRQDYTGVGGPDGDCVVNARPYVDSLNTTSLDGTTTDFCSPALTTCEALNDFRTLDCMSDDATGDALCGVEGQPDGYCDPFGASSFRCTVPCGSDDDCKPGFNCDTAANPDVCEL